MSGVRVIGVGTPYGDDRAGLELAARLMDTPQSGWAFGPAREMRRIVPATGHAVAGFLKTSKQCGCEVVITERPGAELIDLIAGADAVIVLDAVRSGAAPGTVHDLAFEDLPGVDRACSSHGIGVADALALAQALGRRPRGRFIGIEARPGRPTLADPLGPQVAAAVERAVLRVHAWVDHLRGGGNDRSLSRP